MRLLASWISFVFLFTCETGLPHEWMEMTCLLPAFSILLINEYFEGLTSAPFLPTAASSVEKSPHTWDFVRQLPLRVSLVAKSIIFNLCNEIYLLIGFWYVPDQRQDIHSIRTVRYICRGQTERRSSRIRFAFPTGLVNRLYYRPSHYSFLSLPLSF